MTSPENGPQFRAGIARMSLAEYDDWKNARGKYAAGDRHLDGTTVSGLASCGRWLLQMIDAEERAAEPATIGQANLAVAHLDTREMRDVLNVLAAQLPTAVLAAIAEAGHGHG